MDMISLQGKTNFFEKRVSDYARAHVSAHRVGDAESRMRLYVTIDLCYQAISCNSSGIGRPQCSTLNEDF